MIEIILGGVVGGSAWVDDDQVWVLEHNWSIDGSGYVQRPDGYGRPIRLHRELMGFPDAVVDHIDRDRMNNTSANLRIVTARENAQNKGAITGTYRGVYKHSRGKKWVATASADGKSVYLGLHDTEEEAAAASLAWRREHMPGAID